MRPSCWKSCTRRKDEVNLVNRSIVVGVDHSAPSQAALDWAMRRAERVKSDVTLVHVVNDYWVAEEYAYYDRVMESARGLLEKAAARAGEIAPGVSVRTELRNGEIVRVLSDLSEDAALVVVGTDKKGRIEGEIFGTVSLQVATMSLSPVAVIPLMPPDARSGIVVGVDGSEHSLDAVSFAAAEADRSGQDLHVVYACRIPNPWILRDIPEESITKRIEEEEKVVLAESVAGLTDRYPDLVVHQHLETEQFPAKALVTAAANAQLLVVGSRGRGALKWLLMGSVSHEVLLHIPCPTVVTRIRD